MRQVRYQIFISSTFRDLLAERQGVLDAILNIGHFPAGMELFPASDATPWEVIKRVIDDSDYYVVIVGGMYGSTDSDGISYTEKEYDYALQSGISVLPFLHENPDSIPAGKTELQNDTRTKLAAFRKKLQTHHCKYWRDAQDLQYKVAVSLIQEVNRSPATGWVRADEVAEIGSTTTALAEVQTATAEAALQRKLRDEAEQRVQSLEEALSGLKEQLEQARSEIDAATQRESAAIAKERTAQQILRKRRSASKSPPRPPASFDVELGKELLKGNHEPIDEFVIWEETPQGAKFWIDELHRVETENTLSAKARKAIEAWIKLSLSN